MRLMRVYHRMFAVNTLAGPMCQVTRRGLSTRKRAL